MDVPSDDGFDAGARQPVCPVGFCPIGFALTATDQIRPEVVEHLLAAGREFLLAMKAFVDARAEGMARTSPLESIEIRVD
jgi:hypothetical protein